MSVKTKTISMTEITAKTGQTWAKLRFEEPIGLVTIWSDYGNWSYGGWSSIGENSMARFLSKLNVSYCGEKMLGFSIDVPDEEESVRSLEAFILESRREDCLTKEQAREEWERVDIYKENPGAWYYETNLETCEWAPAIKMNPDWRNFWDLLWIPLIKPELLRLANNPGVNHQPGELSTVRNPGRV